MKTCCAPNSKKFSRTPRIGNGAATFLLFSWCLGQSRMSNDILALTVFSVYTKRRLRGSGLWPSDRLVSSELAASGGGSRKECDGNSFEAGGVLLGCWWNFYRLFRRHRDRRVRAREVSHHP